MMRYMLILGALEMGALAVAAQAEPLAVITERPAAECFQYAPAFSFDGQHVAWIEQREPNGDSYVQVMERGGRRKTRRVPEEGRAEAFCWAPDGDVLAHVNARWPARDDVARLEMFDLDLHLPSEIALDALAAEHLLWTASGIQLVLVQGQMGQAETRYLARVVPETGQVDLLTGPIENESLRSPSSDIAFAWSPDGKCAALLDASHTPFLHVWEIGLPGFAPDDYLIALNLVPAEPHCVALGPHGEEILFTAFRRGERLPVAIWRYRPREAKAEPMLHLDRDEESALCMALSPEGDRLALISVGPDPDDPEAAMAATLRVTSLTGEPSWATRRIDIDGDFLRPRGWPRRQPTIAWSPDGEYVAYSIGGQVRVAWIGTQTLACEYYLRQTALAFLMFASDYDEALPGPVHVEFWKEHGANFRAVEGVDWWTPLIDPYVGGESVMRCPLMGEGEGSGYVYPEHLWGKNVGDIENPSKTVLLMDGAPRHEGKRVVAFADGHLKVSAEEDVQKLLDQQ